MLRGVVRDTLCEFLRVGKEKVNVESPCCVQDLDSSIESRSFVGVGASQLSFPHVKEQLRCTYGLSHVFPRFLLLSLFPRSECGLPDGDTSLVVGSTRRM